MAQIRNSVNRRNRFSAEKAIINAEKRLSLESTKNDYDHKFVRILGPASGTAFFLLGDRPAVFSEPTQQVYALNQTAAYVWCRLEERAAPAAICCELAELGIGLDLAQAHVRAALRNWLKLGLLEVEYNIDMDRLPVERSLYLSIAGFDLTIRLANERLARLLTLFEHHLVPVHDTGHVLQVIEANGLIHIFHNKRNVICCDEIELAPSIKAYITEQIVNSSPPNIVFHAACLVRGGKSMLVSGRPGAGKTTLALRLAHGGYEFGGDDIVLIAPDGSATGVPFAPAVKPGAWEIVKQFRSDLADAIIHRRPDAKRVRYLTPTHVARPGRYPVGWIVFITRASGPAKLKPLEPIETMRRLIAGSYSPDDNMSVAACRAINRTLVGADSYELTYSDLAEANEVMERLCNG